jgi:hypothetical protein
MNNQTILIIGDLIIFATKYYVKKKTKKQNTESRAVRRGGASQKQPKRAPFLRKRHKKRRRSGFYPQAQGATVTALTERPNNFLRIISLGVSIQIYPGLYDCEHRFTRSD